MAGVSNPTLAAEVSKTGALGSIAVGATDAAGARAMILETRRLTDEPFNVNVFVHASPKVLPAKEAAWLMQLAPYFEEFGARPPSRLRTIYRSFADDPDMLDVLLETRPSIVSFHFGLPPVETIQALKAKGIILMATATSPQEAEAIENANVDFIVAQGVEAGGHRGVFDLDAPDDSLTTLALTRMLVRRGKLPVIAAGGVMDGAGIAAALKLGAVAAQLGTAFIGCPEASTEEGFRRALLGPAAHHTRMTRLISGRPARSLSNRFTALEQRFPHSALPDYPIAYDAGKALHAAARAKGEYGFGAQWAGQGAPLARSLPAARLVHTLMEELEEAMGAA
jgi:nitronate monooxygenase